MKSPSHTLVVDADIASAAGPDPKHRPWSPPAKACHDTLYAVWTSRGFRVAFDAKLRAEWSIHQGQTARAWLARMLSSGRVEIATVDTSGWVQECILSLPSHERNVALKDSHLVALAHRPGTGRILSNDVKAKQKFEKIDDTRIAVLHWVHASPDSVRWLHNGAPDRRTRTLGYHAAP